MIHARRTPWRQNDLPQSMIAARLQGIGARLWAMLVRHFSSPAQNEFALFQGANPMRVNLCVAARLRIFRGDNVAHG
jgi:hypothetical protein